MKYAYISFTSNEPTLSDQYSMFSIKSITKWALINFLRPGIETDRYISSQSTRNFFNQNVLQKMFQILKIKFRHKGSKKKKNEAER